jgi:hypothetical protein
LRSSVGASLLANAVYQAKRFKTPGWVSSTITDSSAICSTDIANPI